MDATLNRENGDLTVAGQKLGPRATETQFLESDLGVAAKKIPRNTPANYYEVWRQVGVANEVGLTLKFIPKGKLLRISVQFIKIGMRGSQWSKALEDEIKCFHDEWLKEQLGQPPYQFSWGKVLSIIEPHWYSANIEIIYAQND